MNSELLIIYILKKGSLSSVQLGTAKITDVHALYLIKIYVGFCKVTYNLEGFLDSNF